MIRAKRRIFFLALFFIICLFVLPELFPLKNNANASQNHFIYIEDGFSGMVFLNKNGFNYDSLDQNNIGLNHLDFECDEIIVFPKSNSEIKISNNDYQPIYSGQQYFLWSDFFLYSEIYIRKQQPVSKEYQVTFIVDNEEYQTQCIKENCSAVCPETPELVGKVFKGWNKDFSCVTHDLIVTAQFANLYNIEFSLNQEQSYFFEIEEGTTVPINSYEWYTSLAELPEFLFFYVEGHDSTAFDFDNQIINENTVFIACYKVLFNIDYIVENQLYFSEKIEQGSKAQDVFIEDTDDAYFFGWRLLGQDSEYYDFSQNVTNDLTLVAHIETEVCFVTYKLKDTTNVYQEHQINKIAKGSIIQQTTVPNIDNNAFIGWQSGNMLNCTFDFNNPVIENLTLFAVCQSDLITISFDLNGGDYKRAFTYEYSVKAYFYNKEDFFGLYIFDNPYKIGHTFDKWTQNSLESGNFVFVAEYSPQTLYVSYYLQYPDQAEKILCYQYPAEYNTTITDFYSIETLREGWEFLYWWNEDLDEEYTNKTITDNINLTAKIQLKKCYIHLLYDDKDELMEYIYNEIFSIDDCPTCQQGYYYEWHLGSLDGNIFNSCFIIKEDAFIYAEKKIIIIELEYKLMVEDEDLSCNQTINYGQTTSYPDINKQGYSISWYRDNEYTSVFDFSETLVSDTAIYGLAVPNEYCITIDLAEYDLADILIYYDYKEDLSMPDLTESDYSHNGIFYDNNNNQFDLKYMPAYNLTLKVELTTTLRLISKESDSTITTLYMQTVALPQLSDTENENFHCWSDGHSQYNNEIIMLKHLVLDAVYTDKLTYNVIFIAPTKNTTVKVLEDNQVTPLEQHEKDIEGYIFIGWFYDSEFTSLFDFQNQMITQDTSIYGKYQLIEFQIIYKTIDDTTICVETVNYGEKIQSHNDVILEKEGYALGGWSEDNLTLFDFSKLIYSNHILYAQYEPIVLTINLVSFDTSWNKQIFYGDFIDVTTLSICEVTGYTFENWYSDDTFLTVFDFENSALYENCSLYAKYNKNSYIVSFFGFQKNHLADISILYKEKIKGYEVVNTTIEGYSFINWFFDEDCSMLFNFDEYIVEDNCSVYADYRINSYNIDIFGLNKKLLGQKSIHYNSTLDISDIDTTEKTHSFAGWFVDENYSISLESLIVTKSLNIYGKYVIKSFNVTFQGLNKQTLLCVKVNYGQSATAPSSECCEQQGYVFQGFPQEYDCITEDKIIQAIYIPVVYLDENGNEWESSFAPQKDGYEFLKWEQVKQDDIIQYVPVYEKLEIEQQQNGFNFFNSAFWEIFIRCAILLILGLFIIIVKAKNDKKSKNKKD